MRVTASSATRTRFLSNAIPVGVPAFARTVPPSWLRVESARPANPFMEACGGSVSHRKKAHDASFGPVGCNAGRLATSGGNSCNIGVATKVWY